ncbi:MAG: hypothetical protein MMC33_003475 [Icmadophila ericetorum]|nr:hypothetical protein [Icmadophila ericetorum]
MDPLSISTGVASLVGCCAGILKSCTDIVARYQDSPRILSSIQTECSTTREALSLVFVLVNKNDPSVASHLETSEPLTQKFDIALTGCTFTLTRLDNELQDILQKKEADDRLPFRQRAKFLWSEDTLKEVMEELRGQREALNFLVNIVQSHSIAEIIDSLKAKEHIFNLVRQRTTRGRESRVHPRGDSSDVADTISIFSGVMDEDLSEWEREIMDSPAYQKVYRSVRNSQTIAYERRTRSRPMTNPSYNLLDADEDLIELEEHPPLTAISYSKQLENEFLTMAAEDSSGADKAAGSDKDAGSDITIGPGPKPTISPEKHEAKVDSEGVTEPAADADVETIIGPDLELQSPDEISESGTESRKATETTILPEEAKLEQDVETTIESDPKAVTSRDAGPMLESENALSKELSSSLHSTQKMLESKHDVDSRDKLISEEAVSSSLGAPLAYSEASVDTSDARVRRALDNARLSLRRPLGQDSADDPLRFYHPHPYESAEPLPYTLLNIPHKIFEDELVTAAAKGDVLGCKLRLEKDWPDKRVRSLLSSQLNGQNPLTVALLVAALEGHTDIVELFPSKTAFHSYALYNYKYTQELRFAGVCHINISPLHAAALNDHPKTIRLLLNRGAETTSTDDCGWTPLHCAAARGCDDAVRELETGRRGRSMINSLTTDMVSQRLQTILEKPSLGNRKGRYGELGKSLDLVGGCTPLFLAVTYGCPTVTQTLIEKGAGPTKSRAGLSPLHAACGLNNDLNWDWVRILIDSNYPESEGVFRQHMVVCAYKPRHRGNAAENRDRTRLFKLLLKSRCDLTDPSDTGFLPIHFACLQNNSELVNIILKTKPDCNQRTKGKLFWTPLHLAVLCPNNENTITLLLNAGADLDAQLGDPTSKWPPTATLGFLRSLTPISLAVYLGKYHVAMLLIKKYVNLRNTHLSIGDNRRILEVAIHTRRIDALVLFSKQGINWQPKLTDPNSVPSMYSKADFFPIEYRIGVNNIQNIDGNMCTPLLRCVRFYRWEHKVVSLPRDSVLEALLDLGGSVTSRDERGRSVLHYDCPIWVLRVLLNAGADIEARDHSRRTPLLHTVLFGTRRYLDLLLRHGANVHAKDIGGKSAWKLLSERYKLDIFRRVDNAVSFRSLSKLTNSEERLKETMLDAAKGGSLLIIKPPYSIINNAKAKSRLTLEREAKRSAATGEKAVETFPSPLVEVPDGFAGTPESSADGSRRSPGAMGRGTDALATSTEKPFNDGKTSPEPTTLPVSQKPSPASTVGDVWLKEVKENYNSKASQPAAQRERKPGMAGRLPAPSPRPKISPARPKTPPQAKQLPARVSK